MDLEARRLVWRCRRGMKELDVLLERYARAALAALPGPQRQVLARFLELPDPVLADYLIHGTVPPDPDFARLAGAIRYADHTF